jgi:hypothetical protein
MAEFAPCRGLSRAAVEAVKERFPEESDMAEGQMERVSEDRL